MTTINTIGLLILTVMCFHQMDQVRRKVEVLDRRAEICFQDLRNHKILLDSYVTDTQQLHSHCQQLQGLLESGVVSELKHVNDNLSFGNAATVRANELYAKAIEAWLKTQPKPKSNCPTGRCPVNRN